MDLNWYTAVACLFLAIFVAGIMGIFSRKNHFDVDGRTVLLTGGSQGMGRGLGKLLAQKGANVVIVARNKARLDEALNYMSSFAKHPQTQRFHAISADLTSAEENARVLEEVTAWNDGSVPEIVWANAGMSHPSLFIETPLETLRSQMDVNYWAAAYLAHATLKLWLRPGSKNKAASSSPEPQKPRHFIMTSSVICFVGLAGYTPYAPAKSAMRSLADTLRSEVNLYNGFRRSNTQVSTNGVPAADIKIHCVIPGTILSPGYDNEQLTKHPVTKLLEEGDLSQTEDEVALAAVSGLESGGFLITTQLLGHAMRAGALGGSARNGWGLVDTLFSWAVNFAWLFIGPDMDGKVWKWGKTNKLDLPA